MSDLEDALQMLIRITLKTGVHLTDSSGLERSGARNPGEKSDGRKIFVLGMFREWSDAKIDTNSGELCPVLGNLAKGPRTLGTEQTINTTSVRN